MQSNYFEVTIPYLPPGANKTYRPISQSGKPGLILTKDARQWDAEAALIIGAAAGQFEFKPDLEAEYEIVIRWWGGGHDADAHLKLAQDCITRKLGFDDRQIKTAVIQRIPPWGEDEPPEGMQVYIFQAGEEDWVTNLLFGQLTINPLAKQRYWRIKPNTTTFGWIYF